MSPPPPNADEPFLDDPLVRLLGAIDLADDTLMRHTTGANAHLMAQARGALQYIRLEAEILRGRCSVMLNLPVIMQDIGRWMRSAMEVEEDPSKLDSFLQSTEAVKQGLDRAALEVTRGHGLGGGNPATGR